MLSSTLNADLASLASSVVATGSSEDGAGSFAAFCNAVGMIVGSDGPPLGFWPTIIFLTGFTTFSAEFATSPATCSFFFVVDLRVADVFGLESAPSETASRIVD